MSLEDPRPPSLEEYGDDGTDGIELNRSTLTGPYDELFMSLLRQRCHRDGITNEEEMFDHLVAHLNRGVSQLRGKLDDLRSLKHLVPGSLEDWDLEFE